MKPLEAMKTEWQNSMQILNNNSWFKRLESGDLELKHYKSFLRETYFQAGTNPQLQAMVTVYLKNNPRNIHRKFYGHAISEIGHDLLALNDLKALGHNVSKIPTERPLPSTMALTAFAFYLVQQVNPVAYLGYLYHLEFLPTQNGKRHMESLKRMGVPETAMTFLEEHATIDEAHNRLMVDYVNELVTDQATLDDVLYAVRATCELHGKMIFGAFEAVEGARDLG